MQTIHQVLFFTVGRLGLCLAAAAIQGCDKREGENKEKQDSDSEVDTTSEERIVIDDVTVISMSETDSSRPQTVVIDKGRIVEMGNVGEVSLFPADKVVDGTGRFLIPAFADMHAHPSDGEEMIRYLAHGVTTIRIMNGYQNLLQMRDEYESGKRIGPRLIVASPIIDGEPPAYDNLVGVKDAKEARARVVAYIDAGYDQIKLYHNLTADAFLAAVDEAHLHGVKAVGHMPYQILTEEGFFAGYDSCEHLGGILAAIQPSDWGIRSDSALTEYLVVYGSNADVSGVAKVAAVARDNNVWLVPTMEVLYRMIETPEQWEAWEADPKIEYVSDVTKSWWEVFSSPKASIDPELYSQAPTARENFKTIVREAYEAGAKLMVGTDYGTPYIFPGECVHNELAHFVEAGLTPEQALAAATSLPARFLEKEGEFGTIEVGALADLVLLEADPRQDIEAVRRISGVAARGRFFDRDALDEMLETGSVPGEETVASGAPGCSETAKGDEAVIEDFDDGDPFISGDNRQGQWYDIDDGSGGTQHPLLSEWKTEAGGMGNGGGALHRYGGGYTVWGSGVGVSFAWENGRACAYDASVWDGVSFWAKGNVEGFVVGINELDVIPKEEGGRCELNCYGGHLATMDLDACWRRYAVRFDELEPAVWGSERGPINPEELVSISFYVYSGAAPDNRFDFWLDEIAFFKGDKPLEEEICNSSDPDAGDDAGGAV